MRTRTEVESSACRGIGERLIDGLGQKRRRGEAWLAQQQLDGVVVDDGGGDFTLDERAVDDGADGGMILGDVRAAAAAAADAEAADGQRSLGDGIDAVIGAQQGRLQQHAALAAIWRRPWRRPARRAACPAS